MIYGINVLNQLESINNIHKQYIILTDTLQQNDSNNYVISEGALEYDVIYSAKDSIRYDMVDKKIFLFGDADVSYDKINLKASRIVIDWHNTIITAEGDLDSLDKLYGLPLFTEEGQQY